MCRYISFLYAKKLTVGVRNGFVLMQQASVFLTMQSTCQTHANRHMYIVCM